MFEVGEKLKSLRERSIVEEPNYRRDQELESSAGR